MCEAVEHTTILAAIPLKEHLILAEDARHTIYRHIAMLKYVQVVVPELVLDKESHHWTNRTKETSSISDCVEWQIGDNVGTLIVLSNLVARRREERKKNLVLRMILAQLFHQRATLFELTKRSCVEPHILGIGVDLLAQDLKCLALTKPHLTYLLIEAAINSHSKKIQIYYKVVNH